MKVAVTGASGYLGGGAVEALMAGGHEVVSLSRSHCSGDWVQYSLQDDPRQLPLSGVDALVHAAFDFSASGAKDHLKKNVEPSIALIEAALEAGVRKIVLVSSMSSFEGCSSEYGKAKQLIEERALSLGATVVRPGLIWGGQGGGIMRSLESVVAKLPMIPYPAGGQACGQYLIHLEDLSKAMVRLLESVDEKHGEIRSWANEKAFSIREMLGVIKLRENSFRIMIPVPWQWVMYALRTTESMGLRMPFRSDSLLGLVNGHPAPEMAPPPGGVRFREFE